MSLKTKVQNTLTSQSIHGSINTVCYIVIQSISILQLLSGIAHPDSYFYKVVFWTDLTNSAGTHPTITISAIFILLTILNFVVLLKITGSQEQLLKEEGCHSYLQSTLKYLQVVSQNIILFPLIRSTLLQINQSSNQTFMVLGIIISIVTLVMIFPIDIYLSSNTSVFAGQIDRKLGLFTPSFLLIIFRPLFAISSATNHIFTLTLAASWIILFIFSLIQTPIPCFEVPQFARALTSTVTFVCLLRLSNTIFSTLGFLPLELLGIICFLSLIEELSSLRVKYILEEQNSVRQTKILIFFTGKLVNYTNVLESYVIAHYKSCSIVQCKCNEVVEHLASKTSDLKEERVWYQFIVKRVECCFDLEGISKLPRSKMEIETEKYADLVFDLAEIRIVKLQQLGKAHSSVANFRRHLEKHKLMTLWSQRRFRTVLVLLQQALSERCRAPGAINLHANTYADYQQTIGKYFNLLIETAADAKVFWSEMGHRQPFESQILKASIKIQSQNNRIFNFYESITSQYPESGEMIKEVTQDYFFKILNILPGDLLNPLPKSEQQSKVEKKKLKRLSEDLDAFSQNSQTPMFLISVDPYSLGKIIKGNRYFQIFSHNYLGPIKSLDDLIIPEMQKNHMKNVQQTVEGDQLSFSHRGGFILTKKGKLISSNILVQVIPSVFGGLTFAVFLKQLQLSKKIVGVKNNKQIVYSSDSFQKMSDTAFTYTQFIESLTQFTRLNKDWSQSSFFLTVAEEQFKLNPTFRFQDQICEIRFYEIFFKFANPKDCSSIFSIKRTYSEQFSNLRKREKSIFMPKKQEEQKQTEKEMQSSVEQKYEKQQKINKEITEMFKVILAERKGKAIAKYSCIIPLIAGILIIVLLIACIAVKYQNQQTFKKAEKNNLNFYIMMNRIAQSSIDLKMLNLKSFLGEDNSQYLNAVTQAPSIKDAMDEYLSYFDDLTEVDQKWTTLKLQADKKFAINSSSFSMAIPDYLQIPLKNLKIAPSFNFPFAFDYEVPPLSSTQQYFQTFIINSLYFAIPNFRSIKRVKLDPIIQRNMKKSTPIVTFCILMIIIMVISNAIMSLIQIKVVNIKHYSHRFIETLSPEIILQKLKECQSFIKTYRLEVEIEVTEKTVISPAIRAINETQMGLGEKDRTSKMIEVEGNFNMEQDRQQQKGMQSSVLSITCQKRKKSQIFSFNSKGIIILKRLIMCTPVIVIGAVFIVLQSKQKEKLYQLVVGGDGIQFTIVDLRLIRLYGLQLGVYSFTLEHYQSMIKQAMGLIFQLFFVVKLLLTSLAQNKDPMFESLTYGNLCQLDQTDFFARSAHSFPRTLQFNLMFNDRQRYLDKRFQRSTSQLR